MRRVFSSRRLENVEAVAALLREHGIEIKITNGRSFRGAIRGNFSYRDKEDESDPPAVWVVRSEDQPKARELLREAGLLDSGRSPTTYLATPTVHQLRGDDGSDARRQRVVRIKAGLLIAIAAALALSLFALRKPEAPTTDTAIAVTPAARPATTPEASTTTAKDSLLIGEEIYLMPTPKALAAMLANDALEGRRVSALCLSIDGAAAAQEQLDALGLPSGIRVMPAGDCANDAANDRLTLAIGEYRTDGSGRGTIKVEIAAIDKNNKTRTETRVLDVERRDTQWRVRRVVE
jgi:hypothetical protein